ncbi:MAG: hypothetical protein U0Z75_08315 [Deinococcaceae bacterium]
MEVSPIPPSTLPTDMITELYAWNGSELSKVQIGDINSHFIQPLMRLENGQGSVGFSAGITLVAARASTTAMTSNCTTLGGKFNGRYCELPPPSSPTPFAPLAAGPKSLSDTVPTESIGTDSKNFNVAVDLWKSPAQTAPNEPSLMDRMPAISPLLKMTPLSTPSVTGFKYKIMSFNAGNGAFAGDGRAIRSLFCYDYVAKLCNYADEEVARNAIQKNFPDILYIQETWNNICNTEEEEVVTRPDIFLPGFSGASDLLSKMPKHLYSSRVCTKSRPDSDQMDRIVGRENYDYRCAKPFIHDGEVKGGYECIALKKGVFKFTNSLPALDSSLSALGVKDYQSSSVITAPCAPNATNGLDTGFQVERVQPADYHGVLSPVFYAANAHLASPMDSKDSACQAAQIQALGSRIPSGSKALIGGDFNTAVEPEVALPFGVLVNLEKAKQALLRSTAGYDALAKKFDLDPNAHFDPYKRWYFVSNPTERTSTLTAGDHALDHIVSNFAFSTDGCTRKNADYRNTYALASFDHRFTLCTISGFDSTEVKFKLSEFLVDYPPKDLSGPPLPNPMVVRLVTLGQFRAGVLLDYIKITKDLSGDGVVQLGVPADLLSSFLFLNRRCPNNTSMIAIKDASLPAKTISGPFYLQFNVGRGTNNWCI